jgi:hypothetical protein
MQKVRSETQNLKVERYTLGQTTSQATDVGSPKDEPLPTFATDITLS